MKGTTVTMRHRTSGAAITIPDTPEARAQFFEGREPRDWQELPQSAPRPQPGDSRMITPGQRFER